MGTMEWWLLFGFEWLCLMLIVGVFCGFYHLLTCLVRHISHKATIKSITGWLLVLAWIVWSLVIIATISNMAFINY